MISDDYKTGEKLAFHLFLFGVWFMFADDIQWIFFDCFNTLVDDFDETGDESGMGLVMEVPVAAGFYESVGEFVEDYERWRREQVGFGEVLLVDRFRDVLSRCHSGQEGVEQVAQEMVKAFESGYGEMLRLTPGVREMLDAWQGVAQLGVVSNFFLEDWPARVLEEFGLGHYFEFVVNSAEVGIKKPGKEIYRVALEKAGRPDVEQVLFVGDNLRNDVLSPRALGMAGLYFDRSQDRPISAQVLPEGIEAIKGWDVFRPA